MKHTKSRVLAIFLCLLMVFTLMPVSAFAEEANKETVYVDGSSGNDSNGSGDQGSPVATLAKALTLVQDGGTIILQSDITLTASLAISKSVIIDGTKNDGDKYAIKDQKPPYGAGISISGDSTKVTFKNLTITRTLNVPSDSGNAFTATVDVGSNNGSPDDTTPTVTIENCEITIAGVDKQTGNGNLQTTALNLGSGTLNVTGSTIKNTVDTQKVAGIAIRIDAKQSSSASTRKLTVNDSTITGGSGVAYGYAILYTTTVNKSEVEISDGTMTGGRIINYGGAGNSSDNKLTISGTQISDTQRVLETEGTGGIEATFSNTNISLSTDYSGGKNTAAFAFNGTGSSSSSVTVNEGSTVKCEGSGSQNAYLVSFYQHGGQNTVNIQDGTVEVTGNKDDKWINYSGEGDQYKPQTNDKVTIAEGVTFKTSDSEDGSFVVKNKEGNIVNVTTKFDSAVELAKNEQDAVEEGTTIVVGKDATIEGNPVEVPAGLTVDVTKNDDAAQQVKPATGVIVVYGITDGDKTEDKSFDSVSNAPGSDVLNVKEADFKAKAADATSAINAALTEDKKGPVSDVSDNTVYIILNHRVAGTSFKVKVEKDGDIYSESPAEGGTARVFYFTFPTTDNESYQSGSPAKKVIAPGEYNVKLYAGENEISNATKTFKIYEVKYVAGTGVAGTETTVYVDEAGLEAAKSATGSTMGFALSGSNNRWSSPVVEGSDYSFTVTYSGYYQSTGGGTVTPSTTVKTESAKNGSFTVSDKYASAGKTVKVTPKANEGYVVDQVVVTDRNGKTVEVKANSDGTYSFVMPAKAAQPVTVKVTFKEEEQVHVCPSEKYTDVNTAAWYHEGVDYAIKNGLMEGVGSNLFAPDATTTRAMVVTILYRLDGEPAVTKDIPFADVPAGQWYSNAINWAAANGIVDGYGNGKFGPDDTITREQMAAILYRYASYKGYSVSDLANLTGYTDAASVSEWAATAMRWAVAEGLIEGTSATTLSPSGDSTRAQVATILMRFCEGVVK